MKIAISGAGVAGPTLAYWLLRIGHEPVLIEAAPALRTGGYVIDFWGVGYTVAERMGILSQVRDAGYAVQDVRFVDARGRRAGGFSADVFSRPLADRFTSLPRGELAAIIWRTVEGRAETRFGTTITALDADDGGVRLAFDRGPDLACDLLIGADGLHSAVRRIAFGPLAAFERRIGYVVAAFEASGYRPRDELAYVSYGRPGRQISRFALRGDRTMFLLVFTADRLDGLPRDIAACRAALRRVFAGAGWEWPGIDAAMDEAAEIYVDNVSQIVMDTWTRGRVALLGDAAACVSLLAGEGTGLAMTAAYVLAGELSGVGDWRAAFARYEARLRPFIEGKQRSARKFAGFFAPRTAFGLWFRNQATRLMRIPPVANRLLIGEIQDRFDLPDYRM